MIPMLPTLSKKRDMRDILVIFLFFFVSPPDFHTAKKTVLSEQLMTMIIKISA
jgi:hypothetical protein